MVLTIEVICCECCDSSPMFSEEASRVFAILSISSTALWMISAPCSATVRVSVDRVWAWWALSASAW